MVVRPVVELHGRMQLERQVCRHCDLHNRRFFVAAGFTGQPVQLGDLEDLVHDGRRIEPAAPHILAQMIGGSIAKLDTPGWPVFTGQKRTSTGRWLPLNPSRMNQSRQHRVYRCMQLMLRRSNLII